MTQRLHITETRFRGGRGCVLVPPFSAIFGDISLSGSVIDAVATDAVSAGLDAYYDHYPGDVPDDTLGVAPSMYASFDVKFTSVSGGTANILQVILYQEQDSLAGDLLGYWEAIATAILDDVPSVFTDAFVSNPYPDLVSADTTGPWTPSADVWYTVGFSAVWAGTAFTVTLTVDGTTISLATVDPANDIVDPDYALFRVAASRSEVFFRNIKVGSAAGLADLFDATGVSC